MSMAQQLEDVCPNNASGHEPDWFSVTTATDGGATYIDVACKHCGRSGCVGTAETLTEGINW